MSIPPVERILDKFIGFSLGGDPMYLLKPLRAYGSN